VDWEGGDTPQIFFVESAIRLAGHSSDPRAMKWLLNLGMTYRQQVPLSGADSLSVHCLEKIRDAEIQETETRSVVSQLLESFKDDWEGKTDRTRQRRALAAAALWAVSEEFGLCDYETVEVFRLFNTLDISHDLFAVCSLARIVAVHAPDEDTLNRMEELAIHENSWVAAYGVAALEQAEVSANAPKLLEKIGLSQVGGIWKVADAANVSELGAYLLGRFYLADRTNTSDSVAAVIKKGDWRAVSQLLQVISGIEKGDFTVGDDIKNSLVSRIIDKMSTSFSETNLFKFLGKLAPDKLLGTNWSNLWPGWSTESRLSLIDATYKAAKDGSSEQILGATAIFGELERDPVREVRQEAIKAWVKLRPKYFNASIKERVVSKRTSDDELRLAAESLWTLGVSDLEKVQTTLMDSADRRVREACRESVRIHRERNVAQEHLDAVLTCELYTVSMLSAWKHGSALIEGGHTDHLDSLRQHLANGDLCSHQRHWIKMLAEKLDKKIKERKRKETPDWSPPGAITIRQLGKIKFDEVEREALFVIRMWDSDMPGEPLNWEGAGWFTDGMMKSEIGKEATINLADGSCGTVFLATGSMDSFSVSGMRWKSA